MVDMEPHEYLEFRKQRGMTQVEAAQYFGVSLKTYRKYEKGHRPKPYPKDTLLTDGKNLWVGGHRGTRSRSGYMRDNAQLDRLRTGFWGEMKRSFGMAFLLIFALVLLATVFG